MRRLCLSFFLILSLAHGLYAGAEAGQPGGYLRAGIGARAAALGNAYIAVAEGPEAVYWNPAGLAWDQRPSFNTMVSTLSLNRQFSYAAAVLAWDATAPSSNARRSLFPPSRGPGAWGLGWLDFSLGNDFEGRSEDSASFYTFGDRQDAYLLSHGRALFPWWAVGVTAKLYQRRLERYDAGGFGVDLGTVLLLGPQVHLAVQAQDLASHLTWSTGYEERMPLMLRASLAGWAWGDRLLLATQVEAVAGRQPVFGVGLETRLVKVLVARAGWQKDGPTFGGGLNLQLARLSGSLDYAYLPDPLQQGNTQRISLGISF